MEKLVRGIISNVVIDYIEYEEKTYNNRTQTIIKKKTSFSVNNEIFYTFENVKIDEGREEIFYVNKENRLIFFGKDEVNESFKKRSKKEIDNKKNEIKVCGFLNIVLISFCGLSTYITQDIWHVENLPIIFSGLLFISAILFFLLSIANCFFFKCLNRDLKRVQEKIKKEKEDLDNFEKDSSDFKNYTEIKNEFVLS